MFHRCWVPLVAIAGRIGLFLKMVFYHKNFGPRAGMKVTSWYFWELTNLTTRRWWKNCASTQSRWPFTVVAFAKLRWWRVTRNGRMGKQTYWYLLFRSLFYGKYMEKDEMRNRFVQKLEEMLERCFCASQSLWQKWPHHIWESSSGDGDFCWFFCRCFFPSSSLTSKVAHVFHDFKSTSAK